MARRKSDIDRAAVFEAILGDLGEVSAGGLSGPATIPLQAISFNPRQPRKHVGEDGLEELAASIRERGVLEPVIVRPAASGYELVAGERRTRAAALAGLTEVPAIVIEVDDRGALEIAMIENLQREDLNAVEETEALLGLLETSLDRSRDEVVALLQALYGEERGRPVSGRFSEQERSETHALFSRLGRFSLSSFVSNRLPILEFPAPLLEAVRGGKLAFTKAQAIARVEDGGDRQRLLRAAISDDLSLSQIRRRITELRRGGSGESPGHAVPASVATQTLASNTKRLLNRRKLAGLSVERLDRVNELLRELREVLQGD